MKVALGVNQLPTVISFHVEWRRTLYKIKKHQVKFLCFTKSAVFEKAGSSAGWSAGPLETAMVSLEAKMLDSSPGRMSYTRWKYFIFISFFPFHTPSLPKNPTSACKLLVSWHRFNTAKKRQCCPLEILEQYISFMYYDQGREMHLYEWMVLWVGMEQAAPSTGGFGSEPSQQCRKQLCHVAWHSPSCYEPPWWPTDVFQ